MHTPLTDYLHHMWPKLPGGPLTIIGLVFILLAVWLLHRRTRWGGWVAIFISVAIYSIPFLIEFHR